MAEFIPLEYRIAAAQRTVVRRWAVVLLLTAGVAGAGFSYAASWQHRQAAAYEQLNNEYTTKASVKVQARQLIERREAVARRMAKIQEVQDDVKLLSLLQSIAREFSDNDMLEDISLEAHGKAGDERNPPASFFVRVNGVTRSDETLAALLDRLSKAGVKSTPAMAVKPGSNSMGDVLDGKAIRFQATFEMPATRVASASSQGGTR